MSNEPSNEEKVRRRSMEIELGLVEVPQPGDRVLQRRKSKEGFGSEPGSQNRSRRASKELPDMPIENPAGSGANAVKALSSTPPRTSKETMGASA